MDSTHGENTVYCLLALFNVQQHNRSPLGWIDVCVCVCRAMTNYDLNTSCWHVCVAVRETGKSHRLLYSYLPEQAHLWLHPHFI